MTDDQMKEVVDAVNEMREDLNHANADRKIYQDIIKQHEQREINLEKQLKHYEYCDWPTRCPKCGKKLRQWREPIYPYPYPQPIWVIEPHYSSTSPQITWDSNSG